MKKVPRKIKKVTYFCIVKKRNRCVGVSSFSQEKPGTIEKHGDLGFHVKPFFGGQQFCPEGRRQVRKFHACSCQETIYTSS